ncbi:alpha/beta hydrolase [Microbacterium limosum]|uniref:Alpha/beta hydrolase n=1 Tax=Microbacterium limosum TaxID=3079935 RepID=A0AAU0ME75_9MICO|nr:alpha/beta hydrolase [Microbacterium sp. Y20]WOQ68738.1 alpha/beta hydrolase [Microbacterium sp. Y20]
MGADDEFSFLPAQAADAGLSVPTLPLVERVGLGLQDGRSLSALRWGGARPRITLLHGAGLNAHTWDTTLLARAAATGAPEALAIDLPGHGDSSWRGDADYRAETLAPDIVTGMTAWTDSPQVVVGHSLGGLTAARIAALAPGLVRALVIVDITPGIDPSAGPARLREFYAGPTDFPDRETLVDRAQEFGLGGSRRQTERGVFFNSRVRADGRVEWKHHFAHLAAAALAGDTGGGPDRSVVSAAGWEDLAAVSCPITLIRAASGFVSEKDAAEFTRRLPRSRVITVAGPHNLQEAAPEELAGIVGDIADDAG